MAWFQPSGLAFSTSLTSRRSAIGLIVGGGIGSPRGWPLEGGGKPRPHKALRRRKKAEAGHPARPPIDDVARGASRLRLQEPEKGNVGSAREGSPPTLPAGKRGGWLHD